MHSIAFVLELMGDEFKRLGVHMLKLKKISKKATQFIVTTNHLLSTYYDLHYNYSRIKAEHLFELDERGYALFDKIHRDLSVDELELMHHLKKIYKFIISLTELRIDLD